MNKIIKVFCFALLIISSSFLLSACGKKTETTTSTPVKKTTKSIQIELADNEKPYVSLIPSTDGHTLTFKVNNIPSKFSTAEYELIYTAQDEKIEIEKGVSGTVKLEGSTTISKDLLLGTASCTNGCKYKYDEGVTGGTLTLTLTTDDNQYFSYETPFVLENGTDINKNKKLTLNQENFTVNGTVTTKSEYFIAIKNSTAIYSIFSSSTGKGKITSIEPTTVTKTDLTSITGDYTISQ